tara:strand:- start:15126 stop:15359 length:234 start_codon:yes stop_codon:yes gene_type:complete
MFNYIRSKLISKLLDVTNLLSLDDIRLYIKNNSIEILDLFDEDIIKEEVTRKYPIDELYDFGEISCWINKEHYLDRE